MTPSTPTADPVHVPAPTREPVLVAGRQHSGNTMLTVLLGRMPGWYGQSDESTLLEQHAIFDGMPDIDARAAAMIKAIGLEDSDQANWLDDFVRRRWRDEPGLPALTLWHEAMDGIAARRGDQRWAQKGTSYIFYAQEILAAWPDVRMLYMLRNPWDLVASRRRRNPNIEAVLSTCLPWAKGVRIARALEASHPDRFRIVKYEAVTGDGANAVADLCDWLDTPYSDDFLDVPHVNPAENPYVLESEGRTGGLNTSRIYQYAKRLTPGEIARVDTALSMLGVANAAREAYPDLPHVVGKHSMFAIAGALVHLAVAPLRMAWFYLTYLKRSPRHLIARTWRRIRS